MAFGESRLYFAVLKHKLTHPVVIVIHYDIYKALCNHTTPCHGQRVKVKVRIKSGIFPSSLPSVFVLLRHKQAGHLLPGAAGTSAAGIRNVPKREHVYKRKALPPLAVDVSRQLFPSFPSLCFWLKSRPHGTSLILLPVPFLLYFITSEIIYK